jgi:hypothetical protein
MRREDQAELRPVKKMTFALADASHGVHSGGFILFFRRSPP